MNNIRLYVDEDAGENAVIQGLRARHIDVLTTIEAQRLGTTDADELQFATSVGRTIYTFNVRDFVQLHQEYMEKNQAHAGIIIIPEQRYSIGEKIRRLAQFISQTPAAKMINCLEFLYCHRVSDRQSILRLALIHPTTILKAEGRAIAFPCIDWDKRGDRILG
ncbi:MAG: hypothetical protein F6K09_28775 [Merismopedia sp. SIO2A8]|nr:hypothetical protein [Merismopedia sp. SIO2A8]